MQKKKNELVKSEAIWLEVGSGQPWKVGAKEKPGYVGPHEQLILYPCRLNSLHSGHTEHCVTEPGMQSQEKLCDITMSCDTVTRQQPPHAIGLLENILTICQCLKCV